MRRKSCIVVLVLSLVAGFCLIRSLYFYVKRTVLPNYTIGSNIRSRSLGVSVPYPGVGKILVNLRDSVSREIFFKGQWEPEITRFLNKFIRPDQKVLSLGGHIGFHVLQISKLVGNSGKVYCFEPNPVSFQYLTDNVRLNNFDNVEVFNNAAYHKTESLRFSGLNEAAVAYVIPMSHAGSTKVPEIFVQGVRVDDVLSNVNKIDVLQMDIEGSEPAAVMGAQDLIRRSDGLVVIQEWDAEMMGSRSGYDVKEYINFWRKNGYKIASIEENGVRELSDQELLDTGTLRKTNRYKLDVVITRDLKKITSLYN